MAIRTENLTILFVDIAGFTATTSRQSRLENAHLLQTFERTLHPLVKAYKGTLVKSIGDALLLTFRSPTDAMLCAMALQDAMHAHNLEQAEDQRIHIRVAASLGEVRVANRDIFGEPVNVSARIEGVTPADEIYLSEAVYLAMNKAEVPAEEVGFKELSGIPHAIRLYSIPRFATRRLVSEMAPETELGSPILYPYGGMHQRIALPVGGGLAELWRQPRARGALLAGMAALVLGLVWLLLRPGTPPPQPPAPRPLAATTPSAASVQPPAASPPAAETWPAVAEDSPPAAKPPDPAKVATAPTKTSKPASKPVTRTASKPAAPKPAAPAVSAPVPALELSVLNPPPGGWSVIAAKQAYRAGRIGKPEYRQIVQRLASDYESRIRQLKLDYRAGRLSRYDYEEKVRAAKLAYKGG